MKDPREFAERAHGNQTYGRFPYVHHLDAVAHLVRNLPDEDEILVTVAYLHDVLEDTEVTFEILEEVFGSMVAVAVEYLTDPPGQNRKERKEQLYERLALLHPYIVEHRAALIVKAADRCANIAQCVTDKNEGLFNMYKKEHSEFKNAVFRPKLCSNLWERMEELLESSFSAITPSQDNE